MSGLGHFHVASPVHGRCFVRRAARPAAPLLVGFHGYGENAERLLEAMVEIPGVATWHVVAIQALHPFYNTKTGEVVASWMTKLDRELAIADNLRYVSSALDEAKARVEVAGPTVFLGFSQGTAMAYRAAAFAGHECDGVIALTGDAPAEIAGESARRLSKVLIGRGSDDPWYDQAKMESDVARLQSLGAEVASCVFAGGHEWTAEFRGAARDFLRSLAA